MRTDEYVARDAIDYAARHPMTVAQAAVFWFYEMALERRLWLMSIGGPRGPRRDESGFRQRNMR